MNIFIFRAKSYLLVVLTFTVVSILVSCSREPINNNRAVNDKTAEAVQIIVETPNRPLYPTPTTLSAKAPLVTITPTKTLASTSRPTASPTPTRLPTLPPQEVQSLLADLYQNNSGCQLPCWWGFQPGITPWTKARKFLEPIAYEVASVKPQANPAVFEALIPSESQEFYSNLRRQQYLVEEGIIQSIRLNIVNLEPYADLRTMVSKNGEPDEIWVNTGLPLRGDKRTTSFILIAFYPSKGILADYLDFQAEVKAETIVGCPGWLNLGLELLLWDPSKTFTFQEWLEDPTTRYQGDTFQPLEEATGISVEEYTQLLISGEYGCVETPLELWK